MRYEVLTTGRLRHQGDAPVEADDIEDFVDSFVAELEKIGAEDIDVSTNVVTCDVSVSITLEAEDLPSAQVIGGGTIRTAFHAAGAGTPAWSIEWVKATTIPEEQDNDVDSDADDLIDA
jgi:hypothetical protein